MQDNPISLPRNSRKMKKCFYCKHSDFETETSPIEYNDISVFDESVGLQKPSRNKKLCSKPGTVTEETLKTLENMKLIVNELDKTVDNQFKMLSKKEGQGIKLDYEGIKLKLEILNIRAKRHHQQHLDLNQKKCIII